MNYIFLSTLASAGKSSRYPHSFVEHQEFIRLVKQKHICSEPYFQAGFICENGLEFYVYPKKIGVFIPRELEFEFGLYTISESDTIKDFIDWYMKKYLEQV